MNKKILSTLLVLMVTPSISFAEKPTITSLKKEVVQLVATVNYLKENMQATHAELAAVKAELAAIRNNSVLQLDGVLGLEQDNDGNNTAVFSDVNLQLFNGDGMTSVTNGRGNLIIGYNTNSGLPVNRLGSHNIVLGDDQSFSSTQYIITENILSNRDLSVTVANDMSTSVGSNQQLNVGANQTFAVGANHTVAVGANKSISVGANKTEQIGNSASISIGTDANIDIGQNASINVADDAIMNFGQNMNMNIAANTVIDSGDEMVIRTGDATGTLKKNGDITVNGKKITIKASGDLILKGSKILQN